MDTFMHGSAVLSTLVKEMILACVVLALSPVARSADQYDFTWDTHNDRAVVKMRENGREIWHGSLLPAFWISTSRGSKDYVKAEVVSVRQDTLQLRFSDVATGELTVRHYEEGIRFERLAVHWNQAPPAVVALYFGTALLTPEQRTMVPSLEVPFWPDWEAEGFVIPGAKGGPVQSFFRRWDFGNADIALGSFGPAMGTPYAAAYPRPLYSAAMGGSHGWVAFGPGTVPGTCEEM